MTSEPYWGYVFEQSHKGGVIGTDYKGAHGSRYLINSAKGDGSEKSNFTTALGENLQATEVLKKDKITNKLSYK